METKEAEVAPAADAKDKEAAEPAAAETKEVEMKDAVEEPAAPAQKEEKAAEPEAPKEEAAEKKDAPAEKAKSKAPKNKASIKNKASNKASKEKEEKLKVELIDDITRFEPKKFELPVQAHVLMDAFLADSDRFLEELEKTDRMQLNVKVLGTKLRNMQLHENDRKQEMMKRLVQTINDIGQHTSNVLTLEKAIGHCNATEAALVTGRFMAGQAADKASIEQQAAARREAELQQQIAKKDDELHDSMETQQAILREASAAMDRKIAMHKAKPAA